MTAVRGPLNPAPPTPTKSQISWGQASNSDVQSAAEKQKSEIKPVQKLVSMVTSSDPSS